MQLTHYSRNGLPLEPRSVEQSGRRLDKPDGLWVSVDGPDDWPSWCRDIDWGHTLAHPWRVELAPDPGLLVLDRLELLADFTDEYETTDSGWPEGCALDWKRVAQRHTGIIIAPYQWPARLSTATSWYYGWDCASGSIWNADAIASVQRLVLAGGGS